MSAQVENQRLQLANLRRTAPAETAQRYRENYSQRTEAYDARLQKNQEQKLEDAKNTSMDVDEPERLDEIQQSWQAGSENLDALQPGYSSTVAKMERAKNANEAIAGR